MSLELRGYQVFVSSPSGLSSERETVLTTVLEVNEIEAQAWEQTFIPVIGGKGAASAERSRSRAHKRIEECDYLVLILADHWGGPAGDSNGSGSGTREEYDVARECLLGDRPMRDIFVLFKGVPERQLVEPGPRLQKVLDFKAALEEERSLLFATFDDEVELRRILKMHLLRWLRGEDEVGPGAIDLHKGTAPPESSSVGGSGADGLPEDGRPGAGQGGDSALADAREADRRGEQAKAEGRYAKAVTEDGEDLEAQIEYARFYRREGRFTRAIEMSKRVIARARRQSDVGREIDGLGNLGISQRHQGDLRDSQANLSEGIKLAKQSQVHPSTVAYLENNLGLTLRRRGELGQAEAHYTQALRIYEELEDLSGLAYAHSNLSYVIRERGDLRRARDHAQQVVDLDSDNQKSVAMALCNLGLIAEDEEDLDEAKRQFSLALEINRRLGNDSGQAMTYAYLARVKLEQGDEEGARVDAGHAADLNEWSGNTEGIAMSLHVIAQIDIRQEKYPLAESRLKDARDIYVALRQRIGIAGTWADLAHLLARTRRIADAEEALSEAHSVAEGVEHVHVQRRLRQAEAEIERARVDSGNGIQAGA